MEDSKLVEVNKSALKEIFQKLAEKESKSMTQKQFFKFLCDLKIFPDLITSDQLKSILHEVSSKKKQEISEKTFLSLISTISHCCFQSSEPLKMLFTVIKPLCREVYKVGIITRSTPQVKIRKFLKVSPENRELSARSKVLNKSSSMKLSLSGIISPKVNITSKLHSPLKSSKKFLKFLKKPELKKKEKTRLEKISDIFQLFKKKHSGLAESGPKKQARFVENYLDSMFRNVILT